MTSPLSPLPPRLRDSRNLADLIRQQKQNARQLGVGMMGGRWSPAKPLGATAQMGDLEDDDPLDDDQPAAWNTDKVLAVAAGVIVLDLTFEPIPGSLHIRWEGVDQDPTEWSLVGQRVTFVERAIRVGHKLTAAYWYYPSDAEADEPEPATPTTFVDSQTGEDGWGAPALATSGNLLVAIGMVQVGRDVTLNGWTMVGESDPVTSALFGGVSYRMVVLSITATPSTVPPTISSIGFPHSVCLTAAFDGGSTVTATFATATATTTGTTPASNPSSLRVWSVIADASTLTPTGDVVASIEGGQVDIAMTLEDGTSAIPATSTAAGEWCMASLVVR